MSTRPNDKPLSKHETWILDWFRQAQPDARDLVHGLMIAVRKDAPLPPGWWREGEGRESCAMNARTAAGTRAFVKRDRAWRAQQARKAVQ